jgi:phosphoglycolate phosphatase-like HAD superfamily hydrolase
LIHLTTRTLTVTDPATIAVAGDTPSDIAEGRAAGASVVAGVLTGNDARDELAAASATHVLATITELPALLT